MDKNTALYELGRYRKKVADQQREITKLQEMLAGYEQAQKANNAIVAAIVKSCGQVTILQDDINSALKEELGTKFKFDEETRAYTLETVVSTDGREDRE